MNISQEPDIPTFMIIERYFGRITRDRGLSVKQNLIIFQTLFNSIIKIAQADVFAVLTNFFICHTCQIVKDKRTRRKIGCQTF